MIYKNKEKRIHVYFVRNIFMIVDLITEGQLPQFHTPKINGFYGKASLQHKKKYTDINFENVTIIIKV